MIVVVGGQCRNVGKTTLVCEIVRGLPELAWVAVKISRHSHREQTERSPKNDSARYRAAGAVEAYLLRGPTAASTLEFLQPLLAAGKPLIIESNSILEVVEPDYYALVVDGGQEDVKDSAYRFVGKAHAVVTWFGGPVPVFAAGIPLRTAGDVVAELRQKIGNVDGQRLSGKG